MSRKNDLRDRSAEKRAAVLAGGRKKNRALLAAMALCAAVAVGGGFFFLGGPEERLPAAGPAAAHAGELTHPVSLFSDGQCRFFEHKTDAGPAIRYFVLQSSDGVIRSAFDACDSCWPAGKGYRQDGDEMVCQNCRMRFASVKVMEARGGCNPAPLRNEVRGGEVVIRVQDLLDGQSYFDLKKGS